MLITVHYRRYFLTGTLKGLTVYGDYRSDLKLAPRIGSTRVHGEVRDTIIGVIPADTVLRSAESGVAA